MDIPPVPPNNFQVSYRISRLHLLPSLPEMRHIGLGGGRTKAERGYLAYFRGSL